MWWELILVYWPPTNCFTFMIHATVVPVTKFAKTAISVYFMHDRMECGVIAVGEN